MAYTIKSSDGSVAYNASIVKYYGKLYLTTSNSYYHSKQVLFNDQLLNKTCVNCSFPISLYQIDEDEYENIYELKNNNIKNIIDITTNLNNEDDKKFRFVEMNNNFNIYNLNTEFEISCYRIESLDDTYEFKDSEFIFSNNKLVGITINNNDGFINVLPVYYIKKLIGNNINYLSLPDIPENITHINNIMVDNLNTLIHPILQQRINIMNYLLLEFNIDIKFNNNDEISEYKPVLSNFINNDTTNPFNSRVFNIMNIIGQEDFNHQSRQFYNYIINKNINRFTQDFTSEIMEIVS